MRAAKRFFGDILRCLCAGNTCFVVRNRTTSIPMRLFSRRSISRDKTSALARTQIRKNVWHCTRKGFSAQKLPNTTNIMVSATRAASSFRSTKLILLASRHPQTLQIQWFERLGAFRSINIIRSASVCSRLEASERRNHCVCSAKRV